MSTEHVNSNDDATNKLINSYFAYKEVADALMKQIKDEQLPELVREAATKSLVMLNVKSFGIEIHDVDMQDEEQVVVEEPEEEDDAVVHEQDVEVQVHDVDEDEEDEGEDDEPLSAQVSQQQHPVFGNH